MIKKIALSATTLALTLAGIQAHAQNSVTLYGIIDTGFTYTHNSGGSASQFGLSSGNESGSRWGLKGSEDLGGGLKTIFQLENGFNSTTGKLGQGGREFGRQAFAGLSGTNWGTVTLGRQYDPVADLVQQVQGDNCLGCNFNSTMGERTRRPPDPCVQGSKYDGPLVKSTKACRQAPGPNGTRTLIEVPCPGELATSSAPPSINTRSFIPANPNDFLGIATGSNPRPSSRTSSKQSSPVCSSVMNTSCASACRVTLVSASWTIRKIATARSSASSGLSSDTLRRQVVWPCCENSAASHSSAEAIPASSTAGRSEVTTSRSTCIVLSDRSSILWTCSPRSGLSWPNRRRRVETPMRDRK